MKDSLGDRMKFNYEEAYKVRIPMRIPVIIRLDGKCFHQWTKGLEKPFDNTMIENMGELALYLCKEIATAQISYVQSDEISILLHNYKSLHAQAWFSNEIQKMVSVSAGMASSYFSILSNRLAVFDSRVFALPEAEVNNYFVWRQQDASRNSVQMQARALYSHSECSNKNINALQEMIFQKGINWNNLETRKKRGLCVVKKDGKWSIDNEIPIFTQDKEYINQHLECNDK